MILQKLEQQVAETAAVVAESKGTIASIETQFNTANLALMRAKKERETHALMAAKGDTAAIAHVKHARDEQHAAEQTIADLKIALPEAETQLAAAESAAASARRALGKHLVQELVRRRVLVAGQLDDVIAEMARLYGEYEKLGREIANMPDALPQNMHSMTNHEGALGKRRVAAAMPAFFQGFYPGSHHDEQKKEPLATTEARFWNLEPEKAQAA